MGGWESMFDVGRVRSRFGTLNGAALATKLGAVQSRLGETAVIDSRVYSTVLLLFRLQTMMVCQ